MKNGGQPPIFTPLHRCCHKKQKIQRYQGTQVEWLEVGILGLVCKAKLQIGDAQFRLMLCEATLSLEYAW